MTLGNYGKLNCVAVLPCCFCFCFFTFSSLAAKLSILTKFSSPLLFVGWPGDAIVGCWQYLNDPKILKDEEEDDDGDDDENFNYDCLSVGLPISFAVSISFFSHFYSFEWRMVNTLRVPVNKKVDAEEEKRMK